MIQCWNLSPELRPSFSLLVLKMESILENNGEYLDVINMDQSDQVLYVNNSKPQDLDHEEDHTQECPLSTDSQYLEPLTFANDQNIPKQETRKKSPSLYFPNVSYHKVALREDYC